MSRSDEIKKIKQDLLQTKENLNKAWGKLWTTFNRLTAVDSEELDDRQKAEQKLIKAETEVDLLYEKKSQGVHVDETEFENALNAEAEALREVLEFRLPSLEKQRKLRKELMN